MGERNVTQRLTVNALHRLRHSNEPSVRKALNGPHENEWKIKIEAEIEPSQKMKCWTEKVLPDNREALHSKFVLVRRRDESGEIREYKASFPACEN